MLMKCHYQNWDETSLRLVFKLRFPLLLTSGENHWSWIGYKLQTKLIVTQQCSCCVPKLCKYIAFSPVQIVFMRPIRFNHIWWCYWILRSSTGKVSKRVEFPWNCYILYPSTFLVMSVSKRAMMSREELVWRSGLWGRVMLPSCSGWRWR